MMPDTVLWLVLLTVKNTNKTLQTMFILEFVWQEEMLDFNIAFKTISLIAGFQNPDLWNC